MILSTSAGRSAAAAEGAAKGAATAAAVGGSDTTMVRSRRRSHCSCSAAACSGDSLARPRAGTRGYVGTHAFRVKG